MSDRINDAFRDHLRACAADPSPSMRGDAAWWAWYGRQSTRDCELRYALKCTEMDAEFHRQIDDAEDARLCEAEVYPS